MFEAEIACHLKLVDTLREIYPPMTLELAGVFLVICYHERVPLTDIAKRLNIHQVNVSRNVSDLGQGQYKGPRADKGFGLVKTEEDPENRVRKIAYLTPKGIELKQQLIRILKEQEPIKPSSKAKK